MQNEKTDIVEILSKRHRARGREGRGTAELLPKDDPRAREIAEANTILRCTVGSTVHGLSIEGTDDLDEMGICVEPYAHFFGLRSRFDQWVFRTQPEGARSGPGDLDLTVYSLAKWCRLALHGNPTILLPLFVPESAISVCDPVGRDLRAMSCLFVGSNLFGPYLGYMEQQRHRLTNKVKMPNRPELVERYGYDTKYAGHLIRLGFQGIELATTGKMSLPMREHERNTVIAIRRGQFSEAEVLELAENLEQVLVHLQERKALPPPDRDRVEKFVIESYLRRGM